MKNYFLPSLAKAINAYLNLDPLSKERLKKIHGKAVSIELLPFHTTFHCTFDEEGVRLQTNDLLSADAKIRGTPIQMLGMVMTKDNRHRFFADDLSITGDASVGQQVIDLFDELEIDWEEYLSHFTGDVLAHHIGQSFHSFTQFIKNTDENFANQIASFVHEEAKLQPSHEELDDFFSDIDTLRMDVDRVEAKIKMLENFVSTLDNDEHLFNCTNENEGTQ